jgi:hypothetical protein
VLLSFLNVNEGGKKVNKCRDLKRKINFMPCNAIIDMLVKVEERKKPH